MTSTSGSHPFDGTRKYRFQICHPALMETDQSLVEFDAESTYPRAINACIAMIKEFDLPWVRLSHDNWSRIIDRDTLWLTQSGKLISRCHSIFREARDEEQLLIDEPLLKRTSFGWGFYDLEVAMDGMAFKYIGWHLNPILHKYFEQYSAFDYRLFSAIPEIPDWLDAEYFESEQAIVVYGEKTPSSRTGASHMKDDDTDQCGNVILFPKLPLLTDEPGCSCGVPDSNKDKAKIRGTGCHTYDLNNPEEFSRYMAAEMHIALKIQDAFGMEIANAWVRLMRARFGVVPQSEDE